MKKSLGIWPRRSPNLFFFKEIHAITSEIIDATDGRTDGRTTDEFRFYELYWHSQAELKIDQKAPICVAHPHYPPGIDIAPLPVRLGSWQSFLHNYGPFCAGRVNYKFFKFRVAKSRRIWICKASDSYSSRCAARTECGTLLCNSLQIPNNFLQCNFFGHRVTENAPAFMDILSLNHLGTLWWNLISPKAIKQSHWQVYVMDTGSSEKKICSLVPTYGQKIGSIIWIIG